MLRRSFCTDAQSRPPGGPRHAFPQRLLPGTRVLSELFEASEQKRRDYLLLRKWGQELKPQLPEALHVSQTIEDDVELL